jgi:hypothetical protein
MSGYVHTVLQLRFKYAFFLHNLNFKIKKENI